MFDWYTVLVYLFTYLLAILFGIAFTFFFLVGLITTIILCTSIIGAIIMTPIYLGTKIEYYTKLNRLLPNSSLDDMKRDQCFIEEINDNNTVVSL